MDQALRQRVEQVRRRAQGVVRRHGVAWFVACSLLGIVAACLLDYLLRPRDFGSRLPLSLAGCAAVVIAFVRFIPPAFRFRLSELETAQRIESGFPTLAGRLSSSLDFLRRDGNDSSDGSPAMRSRLIAETESLAASCDFHRVIDDRPQRRAFAALGVATVAIAACFIASPQLATLAVERWAMPWAAMDWPRRHHLAWENVPTKIARGDDVEMQLIDTSGELPAETILLLREENGEVSRHVMKPMQGRLVHRLNHVRRSLEYRAFGGDDDTLPWRRLEVVEPIQAIAVTLRVDPPIYAGRTWNASGELFSVSEGSKLSLDAKFERQVMRARIVSLPDEASSSELTISDGGRRVSGPVGSAWTTANSGKYALEIVGDDDVSSRAAQWEIRVQSDEPPSVHVDHPSGDISVTAVAALEIRGEARDDHGVQRIDLDFLRPGASDREAEKIAIYPIGKESIEGQAADTKGDRRSFSAPWDLRTLVGLEVGHVITWSIAAVDAKPQIGRSTSQRLTVVDEDEMRDRLARRLTAAIAQLSEATEIQRETRRRIGDLEHRKRDVGDDAGRDVDTLQGVELRQRNVRGLLGDEANGATSLLRAITTDLQTNRLSASDLEERCRRLIAGLEKLTAGPLTDVEASLSEVLRDARASEKKRSSPAKQQARFVELGERQEAAIVALEALLGVAGEWESFQRLRRDFLQFRESQRTPANEVRKLQEASLHADDASADSLQAEAARLNRSQAEAARAFEKWRRRLQEWSDGHAESEAEFAHVAREVLDTIVRRTISGKMRDVSTALGRSKFGEASQAIAEVDRALDEILELLSDRPQLNDAKTLARLEQIQQELADAARRQVTIAEKIAAEKDDPRALNEAAKDQNTLAEQSEKLAVRLRKDRATSAAESLDKASDAMQRAGVEAKENRGESAAASAKEASERLKESGNDLNRELQRRRAELLNERMVRLEQEVRGLSIRQAVVMKEWQRLIERGAASDDKSAPIRREQAALAEATKHLAEEPELPSTFHLALDWVEREMREVVSRMEKAEIDAKIVMLQQSILDRLERIAQSLEAGSGESKTNDATAPPGDDASQESEPAMLHLAELRLLRALQADVLQAVEICETKRDANGKLPESERRELGRLSEQQGKLAERLLELLRVPETPATKEVKPMKDDKSAEELLRELDAALPL